LLNIGAFKLWEAILFIFRFNFLNSQIITK